MVLVGDVHVWPLVDTRVGIFLIHVATVERLVAKGVVCMVWKNRKVRIVGMGGEELATLGLTCLPVTIRSAMRFIDFCVVLVCPATILLGTGALHSFSLSIIFDEGVLVLGLGEKIPFTMTASVKVLYSVFLAKDLTLMPLTIMWMHTQVAEGPEQWEAEEVDLLLEQPSMGAGLKTAQVARALTRLWRDTEEQWWTIASLANFSHHAIHLHMGTPVGEAEEVEANWTCVVIDTPMDEECTEAGMPQSFGTKDRVQHRDNTSEAPYMGALSWALMDVATDDNIWCMVAQADKDLMPEEAAQLMALLIDNRDMFTPSLTHPGQANHAPHKINVQGHQPVKSHPHQASPKEMVVQSTKISKMLAASVIQPSKGPWASPVVLVTKKDRTTRFCMDYQVLNQLTKKYSYPLPRVNVILDTLTKSVWQSTLNLVSSYWQIPVQERDIKKTAFATQHRMFKFTVMLFSLTNTLASFQCDMDVVLSGLNWVSTLVYIDNIMVFSCTFDKHLVHLQEVFKHLWTANMYVKPSKCNFCQCELPFLRHIMCKDGIAADPEKLQAIQEMAVPANVTEVHAFLGLCNYYHWFVLDFAQIVDLLYLLMVPMDEWQFGWSAACGEVFEELKQKLMVSLVLAFPDLEELFYLHTNVSQLAIGAVLLQRMVDGVEWVIVYASQRLSSSEWNYSVSEWECLSMVYWVNYFHHYLHSSKFFVITDHVALKWLMNVREL